MGYKLWGSGELLTSSDLNNYLSKQAVIVCTSGTRPASPPEGMTVYETDTNLLMCYNGAAWARYGIDLTTNAPVEYADVTSITGITSTTPIAGSPVCGGTFVAPQSAKVFATISGQISSGSNTHNCVLSFEVRTGGTVGSGTVVWATSSDRAIATSFAVNTTAPAYLSASYRALLSSGFTAGSTYNVRTMHSVDNAAGSGSVTGRRITIEPVL
jgi:hypothetical protein